MAPGEARPGLCELDRLGIAVRTASGWRPVVDTVSLTIAPSERIGLVGESGSGKSLTALAILGLLPDGVRVASGRVRLDGTDLSSASQQRLQELRGKVAGLVLQEAVGALNPTFTAGFQLVETLRHHQGGTRRAARARACQALADLGIDDPPAVLAAFPHQLSGGQAQRVNLALALAGQPRLLVADEPVTALDVTTQAQVLRLIARVCTDSRMALLLISHDLAVVGSMVDRIAVMLSGELVEIGPTETLLLQPLHPYTRLLLEASGRTPDGRRPSPRRPSPRRPSPRRPSPSPVPERSPAPAPGCRHADRCPDRQPSCETRHPELEPVPGPHDQGPVPDQHHPASHPESSHPKSSHPESSHLVRCPVALLARQSMPAAASLDLGRSAPLDATGRPGTEP